MMQWVNKNTRHKGDDGGKKKKKARLDLILMKRIYLTNMWPMGKKWSCNDRNRETGT